MGYAPNNCVAVVSGDVTPAEVLALAKKYLEPIPRQEPPPPVRTVEPPQLGERRVTVHRPANLPLLMTAFHIGSAKDPDFPVYEVIDTILAGGRSSRLHRRLVEKEQLVLNVGGGIQPSLDPGLFLFTFQVRSGRKPEEVEKSLYEELDRLKETPVPERELQKVKNNFAAAEYRKLTSNNAILFQLIFNEGLGDWREINAAGPKIQAVTAEDIQRVARKYFTRENRAVAIYTRKPGPAAADPELAALPAAQRARVQQQLTQWQAESDPAKLRAALERLDENLARAPAEAKPLLELLRKKLQARLAELSPATAH